MDAEELRVTTMEDGLRTLLQVTVEQAALADEVVSTLMGDVVEVRKALHRQQRQGREVPGHLMSDQTPHRSHRTRRRRPRPRRAIEPIEIQEEMESSFLDYAMSVITTRALPDARDGLKPVHRRILYGMYDLGARPDRSHMKCARVTGDVMGKYHPHGEGAIYDALVRMAQDFSLRHPLVDGHGNFGSPDFGAAASRYTECRLDPIAMRLLDGIDEDTVDFSDNYSGDETEPEVLPGPLPEPARQRQPGHRGRHGHQHPAAQPRRGDRRHGPPHRPPRGHARRPHAVREGPRLPHRRR